MTPREAALAQKSSGRGAPGVDAGVLVGSLGSRGLDALEVPFAGRPSTSPRQVCHPHPPGLLVTSLFQ